MDIRGGELHVSMSPLEEVDSVPVDVWRKNSDILQMEMLHLSDKKKLKIASAAASGVSGFFGAAGALFFNWIVQWWLRREMKSINGLALFTISISAAMSIVMRIFWPSQAVHLDWQKGQILFLSIACGAIGVVLGKLFEKKLKERHLRELFVGILFFVGLRLVGVIPEQLFSALPIDAWTTIILWSFVAGVSSPPLGMGTGVFLVPTFIGIEFSRDEAILMSLMVSAILMFFGAWLFRRARQLELQDMQSVWLPAIIGTPVGVWLSYQIPPEYFRALFGVMLIAGAGKTLYDLSMRFRQLVCGITSLCVCVPRAFLKSNTSLFP